MSKVKLLVVEDETIFAIGIQEMLSKLGYPVLAATHSGETAVQLAGELRPDLVLMDINLRESIDGIEAARRIWTQFHIPVIFMTAYVDEGIIQNAKIAEPFGYLVKPFKSEDLQAAIEIAFNRHTLERKLSESEEKYRLLFESMAQGVIYYSTDGQIISANPAATRILGLTQDEMKNWTFFDPHWKIVLEDGSKFTPELHPALVAIQTGKDVNHVVMGIYNPCLEKRLWISMNAVPQFMPGEEKPFQVYTIFEDITDRKRAEEALRRAEQRYRSLFEDAPAMYVITREVGCTPVIVNCNQLFCWTVGFSLDELLDRPLADFYSPASRLQLLGGGFERALTGQSGTEERELVTQDGRIVPTVVRAVPEVDATGQVIGTRATYVDITERKRSEELLRQSESRFKRIYESNVLSIAFWDPRGAIVDANDAYLKLAGCTREDLQSGRVNWAKMTPPEYAALDQKGIQEVREKGFCGTFEKEYIKKDGSRVPVLIGAASLEGMGDVAVTYAVDISERKQAEAAILANAQLLEYQKNFFNHIIDSIPSSLLVIDRTMRVISANHNFLEKTRRDLQSTLGHRIDEVFPKALLEYTQMDSRIKKVIRTGQPIEGGKVLYHAPGMSTHIYFYRLIPLYQTDRPPPETPEENSRIENVLLLMDDITDREQLGEEIRRTERHLASVVECANDLVVSLNSQGSIVTWNRAAETISGYKSEHVKGTSLVSLCTNEHQSRMAEMLHMLSQGGSRQHYEINLLTTNSQEVPIVWSCSPMRDDSGKVSGIVAVGRNLADQRRLEEQLILSDKLAALGVMAGGIAHELRNPLGIISAGAQLLMESPQDAQLRKQGLLKINAAAKRASLIIENLLKFSRPNWKHAMVEVNLLAILEETVALLAHQLALNNVSLVRQYQPEIPHIQANLELLQQVFTNLILNACNAMPSGGTLTITVLTATDQVEIHFGDTGVGIPSGNLPKIFDPFFTTHSVGKGIGLGLSISHSIIAQHHGVIDVQSVPDKGSTIIIRLPLEAKS